jgi:hypothetical protein
MTGEPVASAATPVVVVVWAVGAPPELHAASNPNRHDAHANLRSTNRSVPRAA